jgi:hypothetical protein
LLAVSPQDVGILGVCSRQCCSMLGTHFTYLDLSSYDHIKTKNGTSFGICVFQSPLHFLPFRFPVQSSSLGLLIRRSIDSNRFFGGLIADPRTPVARFRSFDGPRLNRGRFVDFEPSVLLSYATHA